MLVIFSIRDLYAALCHAASLYKEEPGPKFCTTLGQVRIIKALSSGVATKAAFAMCLKNGLASALSITVLKVLKTSCEVIGNNRYIRFGRWAAIRGWWSPDSLIAHMLLGCQRCNPSGSSLLTHYLLR